MSELLKENHPLQEDPLPKGWTECAVGAITTEIRSGFSSGRHNTSGIGIPHLRPMSVTPEGKITLDDVRYISPAAGDLRLADGDILFTNTSSTVWVGKTGIVRAPKDWAFSNHMTRLRLKAGMVPEFFGKQLHFLCRSGYFAQHCTEHVNQSSIAPSLLRDRVPLRVPPLEEQRRIATKLDELQTQREVARAHLVAIPDQLAEAKRAILAEAFTGQLTRDWRETNPSRFTGAELVETCRSERKTFWEKEQLARLGKAGKLPKNSAWKDRYQPAAAADIQANSILPEGWAWAAAEELTQPGRPILYGIIKPGPHDPDGVPYVRVVEMKTGIIDVPALPRASRQRASLFSRATLKAGDILISKDGTIGRVALVPPELEGGNITQHVLRFSPSEHVLGSFLARMIEAPAPQEWLTSNKTGVALQGVNVEDFRRLALPVPPLREQQEIVRRLETALAQIDAAAKAHATALADLERLNQSILAKAFRGELVEQDPADEPADIALQRLAAEVPSSPTPQKKRMPRKTTPSATSKNVPLLEILQNSPAGISPEELFRLSGRSELDLEQVEKFYAEIRQLVRDRKIEERRPDSATVILLTRK